MKMYKSYVVWSGRQTGIFNNWKECEKQIRGFPNAKYKSFKTRELAEQAYNGKSEDYIGVKLFKPIPKRKVKQIGYPVMDSISVDGSWNTKTGIVEYQGVYTKTKDIIFRQGPFYDGTNNIVEFLALVHGLAYCKQKNIHVPIYSDSLTAISWVNNRCARTKHKRNDENVKLFGLLDRAEEWLKNNDYTNQILKWQTRVWGENPADFGRK